MIKDLKKLNLKLKDPKRLSLKFESLRFCFDFGGVYAFFFLIIFLNKLEFDLNVNRTKRH